MNPFSTAPLFVSLSANFSPQKRNQQALLACVYAFFILLVFLLLGAAIIDFFGISIPGIRAAGGLVIMTIGFRMLFPRPPAPAGSGVVEEAQQDIAFTPIAMPSLAGPGSIAVVIGAAARLQGLYPLDWPIVYAGVIVGMVATLIFSWLVLRGATWMVKFMGAAGIDAMTRIFGFLLICIGTQFLFTGIGDFFGITRP